MPKISDLPSLIVGYNHPDPLFVANGEILDSSDTDTGTVYLSEILPYTLMSLYADIPHSELQSESDAILLYAADTVPSELYPMTAHDMVGNVLPGNIYALDTVSLSDAYGVYVPVWGNIVDGDESTLFRIDVDDLLNVEVPISYGTIDHPLLVYYEGAIASTSTNLPDYLSEQLMGYTSTDDMPTYLSEYLSENISYYLSSYLSANTLFRLEHFANLSESARMMIWKSTSRYDSSVWYVTLSELKSYFNS